MRCKSGRCKACISQPGILPSVQNVYLPTQRQCIAFIDRPDVRHEYETFICRSGIGAKPTTLHFLLTKSMPTLPLDMKTRHRWKYWTYSSPSSHMISTRLVLRHNLHDRNIRLYQQNIGKASQTHHGGMDTIVSNPMGMSSRGKPIMAHNEKLFSLKNKW